MAYVWGVAACLFLIGAWTAIRLDKKKNESIHRRIMIIMLVGGWAFVLFYLSGYYLRERPLSVPPALVPWIAAHVTIALLTLSGATLLVWARLTGKSAGGAVGLRASLNRHHRLYGRVVVLLWLFTHVGGIVNLYLTR